MQLTFEQKKKLVNGWRTLPEVFLKSFFGIKVWSKQQEVLNALRDNKRVAVKSGNTVGKSCIAAGALLWYLSLNTDSIVITTAPTWMQVEDVLWREIAGMWSRRNNTIPLTGTITKTKLEIGDNWYAEGISTNEPERFLGRHSKRGKLMVIIDEAYGVPPEIWESISRLHPDKILAIGNPDSTEGQFYQCFLSPIWEKITISCQECVVWQNENGRIPGLVNQEWIDERREEWGVKSPLYQSSVLGEFPSEGTDALISIKWVDEARKRKNTEEEDALRIVAADVATKHGGAQTVIVYRVGHTIKEIQAKYQIPTTATAGIVKRYYQDKQADSVVVDSDGVGEGVSDILAEQRIGVYEFHGGYASKPIDKLRFRNLRTQFYWIVAKKFEKGLYDLSELPQKEFEQLKSQLCSVKVRPPDSQGRMQIETKEDMLARQVKSPDMADAMVYSEFAFFSGAMSEIKSYSYR